jgi:hypothetical protein
VKFALLILLISFQALAELNHETHDFSFEYGLAYQTLKAEQKDNGSKGQFTSDQNPYWIGGYTYRLTSNWGVRLFGGISLIRMNEPAFGTVKNEDQALNQYGLELIHKTSLLSKLSYFYMEQDRPLYYAKAPTVYEITKEKFLQAGLHFSLGQRRRIGLIWGTGVKLFTMFPAHGGDVVTETGAGAEGYARLGWVDPFGTLYQIKGIYQGASAPNAEVNFTHEILGYSFLISHTF